MPIPQTFKRSNLAPLEYPYPIISQRALQLSLVIFSHENAKNLPIDLETVEEVGDVQEVCGGGVFAVDVEPDEANGLDCATEDLGEVEGVDVGESGLDEGEGRVVVCILE